MSQSGVIHPSLYSEGCYFNRVVHQSAAERIMASYESDFVDGQLAGMEMAKAITFKRVERVFDYSKPLSVKYE